MRLSRNDRKGSHGVERARFYQLFCESTRKAEIYKLTTTQGMQRFGNSDVSTHAIGLALLQQRWEYAFSLVMRDRDHEPEEVRAARRQWNDHQNADRALKELPRHAVAERCGEFSLSFSRPTHTDAIVMLHIARQRGDLDYMSALGSVRSPDFKAI
jgi:tRNA(Glu) U13 pseudouridine synthase TruD